MIRLRRVRSDDSHLLWKWRTAPDVNSMAFNSEAIPWTAHQGWFAAKIADPHCILLIAEGADGRPVGQVRFDIRPDGMAAEISVSIDRPWRGQGMGAALIEAGVAFLMEAAKTVETVHALIRRENTASIRAFSRAGFVAEGPTEVRGLPAEHLVWYKKVATSVAGGGSWSATLTIGRRQVGPGLPVYVIAEISANHNGRLEDAIALVELAKASGADAVKMQTYTADTLTLDCDNDHFLIEGGTPWDGRTLHALYEEAAMPWEWQPRLKEVADQLDLDCFSSPFDATAVDFLEGIGVPAYKIASFELVDLPLIRRVANTGKPIIMSTGMATVDEIWDAVSAAREAGAEQIALLKCTSAYPAPARDANLRAISFMADTFGVPVGLSDHTLGIEVPVAAVALGACIVEKHFTLSRDVPGPDSAFSLEPNEFRDMVVALRSAETALGSASLELTSKEESSKRFRRSLFAVKNIARGQLLTPDNVRSIRPADGLPPKYYDEVLRRRAAVDIPRGTPLRWDLLRED